MNDLRKELRKVETTYHNFDTTIINDSKHCSERVLANLKKLIKSYGISIKYKNDLKHIGESTVEVLCNSEGNRNIPIWGTLKQSILIKDNLDCSSAQLFMILLHELSHCLCEHHKKGILGNCLTPAIASKCETEAQAIAYNVCKSFGIDYTNYSANYICNRKGNIQLLNECLPTIENITTTILEGLRNEN